MLVVTAVKELIKLIAQRRQLELSRYLTQGWPRLVLNSVLGNTVSEDLSLAVPAVMILTTLALLGSYQSAKGLKIQLPSES